MTQTENCSVCERLNYYKADYDALRKEMDIDWDDELKDKGTIEMLNSLMEKFNRESYSKK